MAHEGVDRVVDREPDQQHRDGDEHLVERDIGPAHEPERHEEDGTDPDDPENDIENVPVGDGEGEDDEQQRERSDDRQGVGHRAVDLVGYLPRPEDKRLVVFCGRIGEDRLHRELGINQSIAHCTGRQLSFGRLGDDPHGGIGVRTAGLVGGRHERERLSTPAVLTQYLCEYGVDLGLVHRGELLALGGQRCSTRVVQPRLQRLELRTDGLEALCL